ncbi:MAG TPA: thioredoxin domain-containing protein [Sphingomicrobium sp.]|nr:thioredoxin domain-containing protein [Sphingomicrobium sp.]
MKLSNYLVCVAAVAALSACNSKQENAASNEPLNLTPVAPPKGGDWTQTVSLTPDGGMLMGNPDAKVKLIEYGSLTCPHCREFDEKGAEPLMNTYVKSGQVSWEFRNYVRDAFDLAATLIARCNGPSGFFPMARALYKDQPNWEGKLQTIPQPQLEALQTMPSAQIPATAARLAGLQDWAVARGLTTTKSAACLADTNAVNKLVEMNANATQQYPDFPGTPTFILNGKLVDKTATWEALEPKLREALR